MFDSFIGIRDLISESLECVDCYAASGIAGAASVALTHPSSLPHPGAPKYIILFNVNLVHHQGSAWNLLDVSTSHLYIWEAYVKRPDAVF